MNRCNGINRSDNSRFVCILSDEISSCLLKFPLSGTAGEKTERYVQSLGDIHILATGTKTFTLLLCRSVEKEKGRFWKGRRCPVVCVLRHHCWCVFFGCRFIFEEGSPLNVSPLVWEARTLKGGEKHELQWMLLLKWL